MSSGSGELAAWTRSLLEVQHAVAARLEEAAMMIEVYGSPVCWLRGCCRPAAAKQQQWGSCSSTSSQPVGSILRWPNPLPPGPLLQINGSLARAAIRELLDQGLIKASAGRVMRDRASRGSSETACVCVRWWKK